MLCGGMRALCGVPAPPSCGPRPGAPLPAAARFLSLRLPRAPDFCSASAALAGSTPLCLLVDAKARVRDLRAHALRHLKHHDVLDAEVFGVAVLSGIFIYLHLLYPNHSPIMQNMYIEYITCSQTSYITCIYYFRVDVLIDTCAINICKRIVQDSMTSINDMHPFFSGGDYLFPDLDSKLSKYAPKSWRSSHTHVSILFMEILIPRFASANVFYFIFRVLTPTEGRSWSCISECSSTWRAPRWCVTPVRDANT